MSGCFTISGSQRSRSSASSIWRTRFATGTSSAAIVPAPIDTVGLEHVAVLEALDGLDERARVEGRAVGRGVRKAGVRRQVAESLEPRGERRGSRPGLPGLDLLLLGLELGNDRRLARRGDRAVFGEGLDEPVIDGEGRLRVLPGLLEAARPAARPQHRREVEALVVDVVIEAHEPRVDAAVVGARNVAYRADGERDVEEPAVRQCRARGRDPLPLAREPRRVVVLGIEAFFGGFSERLDRGSELRVRRASGEPEEAVGLGLGRVEPPERRQPVRDGGPAKPRVAGGVEHALDGGLHLWRGWTGGLDERGRPRPRRVPISARPCAGRPTASHSRHDDREHKRSDEGSIHREWPREPALSPCVRTGQVR